MAKGAVYLTASTDGKMVYDLSTRTSLKRSNPWALNDIETELFLKRKPSKLGNASICRTVSTPLTDRVLRSRAETAKQPADSENSTTGSVVDTEEDYESDASFSLCAPRTKTKGSKGDFVKKREPKRSKKFAPKNNITDVKKLLATGLLEGVPVKYIFQSKKIELSGIIKDDGYLCGCSKCNYSKVLSANGFERHAKCSSSHPNNHIFLENKKSLHVVVRELKGTPPELLAEAIQTGLGSTLINEKRQVRKGE